MANVNENALTSESQCAMIREWLEQGNTITSLEALTKFGCMRLASRVFDLRERGLDVQKRTITLGNGKRVCEYYINQ